MLETLRADNWTFFGVPTAQIVSLAFVIPAIVILMWRHRGRPIDDDPPTFPEVATWGAIGRAGRSGRRSTTASMTTKAYDDDFDETTIDDDDPPTRSRTTRRRGRGAADERRGTTDDLPPADEPRAAPDDDPPTSRSPSRPPG